jgi:hypothetical protein
MHDQRDSHSEQIGDAIRSTAATVDAPPSLRARLGAPPDDSARYRWRPLLAAATAIAILAIALLTSAGDSEHPPDVHAVAAVGLAEPTQAAPAANRRDPRFLDAAVGSVRFPNYSYDGTDWPAVGADASSVDGRRTLTVYYRAGERRVGYAIVDGKPLTSRGRRLDYEGTRFAVLREDGALVVTWRRSGHTCVLAARGVPLERLLDLATWT